VKPESRFNEYNTGLLHFARHIRVLLLGAGALLLGGCSAFGYKPVMPYEREALASPLMAPSRDPISDRYLEHVLETREGARGAAIANGGGCGCN
jgi:hypothetical protein